MLVPVIGLVQVGIQSMADRYTYFPLVGIFVILAWSGAEIGQTFPSSSNVVGVIGAMVLIAALLMTSIQLCAWRDSQSRTVMSL